MKRLRVILTCVLLALFASRPAYAYLDPGSGSMLLQLVLGGIGGLVVLLKLFWQRLRTRLGISKKTGGAVEAEPHREPPPS